VGKPGSLSGAGDLGILDARNPAIGEQLGLLHPIVSHLNIFKPPKVTMVLNKQDVETSWDGHRNLMSWEAGHSYSPTTL
jgi:hypothetical protein